MRSMIGKVLPLPGINKKGSTEKPWSNGRSLIGVTTVGPPFRPGGSIVDEDPSNRFSGVTGFSPWDHRMEGGMCREGPTECRSVPAEVAKSDFVALIGCRRISNRSPTPSNIENREACGVRKLFRQGKCEERKRKSMKCDGAPLKRR